MDEGTWLHAPLAPPPDGPQARARGEVTVISSDGGVTIEVTVRQLDLPQGSGVVLRSGDRELTRFTVAGGSGSHGETLDPAHGRALNDGGDVTLHLDDAEVAGRRTALMHGALSETDGPA